MYIAMNRFKIAKDKVGDFENLWKQRRSRLSEMNGFVEFRLLRGPEGEDHTLYATHTLWNTYQDFKDWTQSEQFKDSHKNTGEKSPGRSAIMSHPQFEGFDTVIVESREDVEANAA